MSPATLSTRVLIVALAFATVATTGCSFFRKGSRLYTAENRPLEVPPDLDTSADTRAAAAASVTASGTGRTAAASQSALGFAVTGTRDEAYARVGEALGAVQGLTIASRAQLLGAYDVTYGGASFLVRVSAGDGGAYVSAVDARGLPATGDAPKRLIETLRTTLVR